MTEFLAPFHMAFKHLHMLCAYLTISLLIVRVGCSVYRPALLQQFWAKRLPHIIDTILLLMAILLTVQFGLQAFVIAKIVLVLLYIASGFQALKGRHPLPIKLLWLGVCIALIVLLVGVGRTHSPWSWFALI